MEAVALLAPEDRNAPVLEVDAGADAGARSRIADARALVSGMVRRVEQASDADLVALAQEVEDLGRVVDALRVRVAGEVGARSERTADDRLSARFGCRSAVELLERATGAPSRSVNERIRLDARTHRRVSLQGEALPASFPAVADAFYAGRLGEDAARLITDTLARIQRRGVVDAETVLVAERELVAAGTGLPSGGEGLPAALGSAPAATFAQLRVHVDTWAAWLDQDGIEPDAERASRNRCLTLGGARDGLVPIRGELLPEVAAGLQRLLDAHLNPAVRFVPARAAGPASLGEGLGTAPEDHEPGRPWERDAIVHDPRTAAQKRHDVLAGVIQTAAGAADTPTLGGGAPTLLVTITADALASGGPARVEGCDSPAPASLAHRIACTGAVQKILLDAEGRIIRLGSPQRVFNAHQRRAIIARDGGCVIPGCTIPAGWCEIHHVHEHARGGPTHTDNGVLLCWWHHHNLDRSGWEIRMRNGVPEVRAPAWIDPHRTYRPTGPPRPPRAARSRRTPDVAARAPTA